jgi:hypothetical protein
VALKCLRAGAQPTGRRPPVIPTAGTGTSRARPRGPPPRRVQGTATWPCHRRQARATFLCARRAQSRLPPRGAGTRREPHRTVWARPCRPPPTRDKARARAAPPATRRGRAAPQAAAGAWPLLPGAAPPAPPPRHGAQPPPLALPCLLRWEKERIRMGARVRVCYPPFIFGLG